MEKNAFKESVCDESYDSIWNNDEELQDHFVSLLDIHDLDEDSVKSLMSNIFGDGTKVKTFAEWDSILGTGTLHNKLGIIGSFSNWCYSNGLLDCFIHLDSEPIVEEKSVRKFISQNGIPNFCIFHDEEYGEYLLIAESDTYDTLLDFIYEVVRVSDRDIEMEDHEES